MFADDAYQLYMNIYVNNIKYAIDDIRNKDIQNKYFTYLFFFTYPFHVLEMCF